MLFADDTSIFSVAHDISLSSLQLNDDLSRFPTGHIKGVMLKYKMPYFTLRYNSSHSYKFF